MLPLNIVLQYQCAYSSCLMREGALFVLFCVVCFVLSQYFFALPTFVNVLAIYSFCNLVRQESESMSLRGQEQVHGIEKPGECAGANVLPFTIAVEKEKEPKGVWY